jgi:hypothetical protein
MSELDIRAQEVIEINTIRVADRNDSYVIAELVVKSFADVSIDDSAGDGLLILNENHARDLIKGIEQAIKLGWFNAKSSS